MKNSEVQDEVELHLILIFFTYLNFSVSSFRDHLNRYNIALSKMMPVYFFISTIFLLQINICAILLDQGALTITESSEYHFQKSRDQSSANHSQFQSLTYFEKSSLNWLRDHLSWIKWKPYELFRCDTGQPILPSCVDGVVVGYQINNCPEILCLTPTTCQPTFPDVIDIWHITSETTNSCSLSPLFWPKLYPPSYGLDQGLPPLDIPIQPIPLRIIGKVKSSFNNICAAVSKARITIWHVNPQLTDTINAYYNLYNVSCKHATVSDEDGDYVFETTLPPSYGPPRHVNVMVQAKGYETLVTSIYFQADARLQELMNEVNSDVDPLLLKILYQANRVLPLSFVSASSFPESPKFHPSEEDLITIGKQLNNMPGTVGYLQANFDIVLQPTGSSLGSNYYPEVSNLFGSDLEGLWVEQGASNGLILLETRGHSLHASEYPGPRRWGAVSGYLVNGAIRGISFHDIKTPPHMSTNKEQVDVQGEETLGDVRPEMRSVSRSGLSTGVVELGSAVSSDPNAAQITWTGGNYLSTWSKLSPSPGYR